ncbi:MAG: hypothetical protein KKD18_04920 [Nanoarchaeota archaeon]|nr:hypothetical protein [Nanoarchaeota archaeon]MBU0977733.1 hypothetical protein [Nanoarchaeota archaeon]
MIDLKKIQRERLKAEYQDIAGLDTSRAVPLSILATGAAMTVSAVGIIGYSALRAIKGEICFDELKRDSVIGGFLGVLGLGGVKMGYSGLLGVHDLERRIEEYKERLYEIEHGPDYLTGDGQLVRHIQAEVVASRPLETTGAYSLSEGGMEDDA